MLASLSVTHGFLPPHPSPTALVAQFHADMGTDFVLWDFDRYPNVILAGPFFAKTLKNIESMPLKIFNADPIPADKLPGLGISVLSAMLPVILIALTTILGNVVTERGPLENSGHIFQ